jgi:Cytochrome c3
MKLLAGLLAISGICAAPAQVWFSHKRHAPIGMACTSCHTGGEKSGRAGMPAAARCLNCHKGTLKLAAKVRRFQAEYDNLPEYVRFSHARHARGKIGCAECHGDVTVQEQTEPARALNMKACVDCHTRHGAKIACGVCHSIR